MKIKDIGKSVKESLIKSTSHGIPKILESENWTLRLVWICFTIISTSFCAYLITKNIMNYYNYEVTTKTRTNYQYDSIFPSITICNHNLLTNFESMKTFFLNNYDSNATFYFWSFINHAIKLGKIREMGDTLEKLITKVSFSTDFVNVTSEIFTYQHHQFYGNCYTFNNHKYENGSKREPILTETTGRFYGLSMRLNFDFDQELEAIFKYTGYYFGGVLYIHEFGSLPFSANEIFISPGYLTSIALQRTITIQKPKPYSNCELDNSESLETKSELYEEMKNRSIKYSQALCFKICKYKYMIEKCSCYYDDILSFPEDIPCINDTEIECVFFEKNYLFLNHCLPNCPLECEKTIFTKTISTIKMSKELKNETEGEIDIYFQDYTITEITESEVIDMITLISNIGGIAGLFLGISFLTILEVVAISVEVIRILIKNKKKTVQSP